MNALQAVRSGLFYFGLASFLFGISDRTIAALQNGWADAIELSQIFTASFFLFAWWFIYFGGDRTHDT